MEKNFWEKLKKNGPAFVPLSGTTAGKPFFALAPMHEVADTAFRRIVAKMGKPDLMFTEMVSADGLVSEGKKAFLPLLKFSEEERPLVCQLFGAKPENFARAASIVAEMGFDGIDINMGCPQDKILKQGAGAALIREPELAKKIISETKKGAGDLPVSVKTRLGWDKNTIGEWMKHILETEPAAISIHGRTKKQMFGGEADWNAIKDAVNIAQEFSASSASSQRPSALIIGNGDIKSVEEGLEKAAQSKVDGVMIGRAILGNPWIFSSTEANSEILFLKNISENDGAREDAAPVGADSRVLRKYVFQNSPKYNTQDKLSVMIEHAKLFEEIYKEKNGELSRNFNMLKKHFAAYASGFDGAKELRMKLMEARNGGDVERVVRESRLV